MRWTRDPFAVAAVALAGTAFAGSFDHTRSTIVDNGQGGWIATATALMPEVSVLLSVLRIRRGGRPAQVRWAWLVLASSASFTLWANLAQAEPTPGGFVVAGWPAWAAIGAAGFIEISGEQKAWKVRTRSGESATKVPAPRVTTTPTGSPAGTTPVSTPTPLRAVAAGVSSGPDVAAVARRMREELGRWPSARELAAAAETSPSTANRVLQPLRESAA